jgi:hypothetical protein
MRTASVIVNFSGTTPCARAFAGPERTQKHAKPAQKPASLGIKTPIVRVARIHRWSNRDTKRRSIPQGAEDELNY